MDEDEILRVHARIKTVTLTSSFAELVLSVDPDDDLLAIAQAAGRECAIALQLAPAQG